MKIDVILENERAKEEQFARFAHLTRFKIISQEINRGGIVG